MAGKTDKIYLNKLQYIFTHLRKHVEMSDKRKLVKSLLCQPPHLKSRLDTSVRVTLRAAFFLFLTL
jgi:hypothetical protein